MSEETEITFMQTRLIRLASEEWHLPVEQIIHLFKEADVLGYIEKSYEIFHCEGEVKQYRIVGCDEFDPAKNWISIDSPVARALIGKGVGLC